jgi:hypothetical protein
MARKELWECPGVAQVVPCHILPYPSLTFLWFCFPRFQLPGVNLGPKILMENFIK